MRKLLLLLAFFVFMASAGDVFAKGEKAKEVLPKPPEYKTRAELETEIDRLEALSDGRSWQEDFTLGVAYMHAGMTPEALMLIEKTLKERPSFEKGYASLGMARFRSGDLKGAIVAWERALKADPKAAHLRRMSVVANDRLVIGKQVDELLKAIGTGKKKGWEPHLELARLYLKLRKADVSMVHIKKAIKIKGEDLTLLETLGKAHAGMGDYKLASAAFKKALALSDGPNRRRLQGMLADMELFVKRAEAQKKKSGKKGK